METITISDSTKQQMDTLKEELYGGELENDTFIYLVCSEILEE